MSSHRRLDWQPPAITAGGFAIVGLAAGLGLLGASDGSPTSNTFVNSIAWLSWVGLSAVALLVFAVMIILGTRLLGSPQDWGLIGDDRQRSQYVWVASGLIGVLVAVRLLTGGRNPDLPVTLLPLRTGVVLFIGLLASIPWLTAVWLAHTTCRQIGQRILGDPAELTVRLSRLWQLILTIVTAFAATVVTAILGSGALRSAFVLAHPERENEFPPTAVLLYGALFAVLLAIVTLPLVAAWRGQARRLVDHLHPMPDAQREKLEHQLSLDVPLIRNPLTVLSVFTPLIASLIAAFVPQLA